ncbi:MAG: cupin domain-containing protein [Phycisphaerales bacterium JB040]
MVGTIRRETPRADGVRVFSVMGTTCKVLLSSEETRGALSTIHVWVPAGFENPAHLHWYEDEHFLMVRGELQIVLDGATRTIREGEAAFAPRRVPHAFRNTTLTTAEVIVTVTPGGLDRFFKAVHEAGAAGRTDMETVLDLIERHGMSAV